MVSQNIAIVVVGYNRPDHLYRCLNSLAKNIGFKDFKVQISLDGPLMDQERTHCDDVRGVANDFAHANANVKVFSHQENVGLSCSILGAIDSAFSNHEAVIVIEDDLYLNQYFLEYCKWGLTEYELDKRVGSISGFTLPILERHSDYFLLGADCWGWATWRDRWEEFERDGSKLLAELRARRLQREFDLDFSYQYTHMLERQVQGTTNSWAIRWHAHNFLRGKLALYPKESLVLNLGNDGSGTNMKISKSYETNLENSIPTMKRVPVVENIYMRKQLARYYEQQFPPSFKHRMRKAIRRYF